MRHWSWNPFTNHWLVCDCLQGADHYPSLDTIRPKIDPPTEDHIIRGEN